MYHIGQTGKSIQKGLEFDFVIYDIVQDDFQKHIGLQFTSGQHKGKYSHIRESEIDNTLVFNPFTPGTANTAKAKTHVIVDEETVKSNLYVKTAESTSPSNKKRK